ncbi:MAG: PTS ascorbate transporter subunit IIC [Pirellulaceae bacterium]
MAKRDSFLLRIDPNMLAALRRWADDDLRSVNGQLEFLLRKCLKDAGRLPSKAQDPKSESKTEDSTEGST